METCETCKEKFETEDELLEHLFYHKSESEV